MTEILDVTTRHQVAQFLAFPDSIYPTATRWVAPLRIHVRHMMGSLQGADRGYWLALEQGQLLARLGARVHHDRAEPALHFGFFECRPGSQGAVRALFSRAHQIAPELPMRGPYHYHQEDPYAGILVQGFDENPTLMMPYNPPYYEDYLAQAGLEPLMDLYSYEFARDRFRPDLMRSRANRAFDRGVRVRTMDPWRRHRDMSSIIEMVNQTHSRNWGFEEYKGDMARELLLLGRFFLEPGLVFLAFHGGQPVGFVIIVRDFNPLLKPARGRLGLGLLWRFLFGGKRLDVYRGYGIGVLEGARALDVGAALVQAVVEESQRHPRGRVLEVAWTLANNRPMNALAVALGGRRNKVHRIFQRAPG